MPLTIQAELPYLGPDRQETLDVYRPDDSHGVLRPAVVHIHGGGWTAGDKASAREKGIGHALAEAGFVVFSINYLLNEPLPGVKRGEGLRCFESFAWPQNLEDCKAAIRFVRQEAERFGVDSERIAVMGCSAGGHLAMMVGLTGETSEQVRAIVNFYGPYDLTQGYAFYFPEGVAGEASPRRYLREGMPPLLVTHGTADDIVPVDQARELVREVRALGVECPYYEVEGGPHSYEIVSPHADLRGEIVAFLRDKMP